MKPVELTFASSSCGDGDDGDGDDDEDGDDGNDDGHTSLRHHYMLVSEADTAPGIPPLPRVREGAGMFGGGTRDIIPSCRFRLHTTSAKSTAKERVKCFVYNV